MTHATIAAEAARLEADGGALIAKLDLYLQGDFDVSLMQRILTWVAPAIGGEPAPLPLPGGPPPTERSPAGQWAWASGETRQSTKIWAGASSGPPGDFPWMQEHRLQGPRGRVLIACATWMLQQHELTVTFEGVSPGAFVAAHRGILRGAGEAVKATVSHFNPTRIAVALHEAGRTDLATPYAAEALAAVRADPPPYPVRDVYAIAQACGIAVPEADTPDPPVELKPLTQITVLVLAASGDLDALDQRLREDLSTEQRRWLLEAACANSDREAFVARILEVGVDAETAMSGLRTAVREGRASLVAPLLEAGAFELAKQDPWLWKVAQKRGETALIEALRPLGDPPAPTKPAPRPKRVAKPSPKPKPRPAAKAPSIDASSAPATAQDPGAWAALQARSLDEAELRARALPALVGDPLVATVHGIHGALFRPEDRAPLLALGFDWSAFNQRLLSLKQAGVGFTGSLPIHLKIDGAARTAEAERLLAELGSDLAQLRALAPRAFARPEQTVWRETCLAPDGTSHFELAKADPERVYWIHLQDAAEFIFEELPLIDRMTRAQGIMLFGDDLYDGDVAEIDFSALTHFRVLDLAENALTQVPAAIRSCAALESLSLARNPGLRQVGDVSALVHLRRLDLRGTAVSDAVVARVRAQLPGCEVSV